MLEHDRLPEPDPRSWVRITSFDAESPEQLRRAMRFVEQQVLPVSRQTPGWKGVLSLASADGRRGMMVTFWDSLEALVSSGRDASMFLGAASAAGIDVVSHVERLEVILEEWPE